MRPVATMDLDLPTHGPNGTITDGINNFVAASHKASMAGGWWTGKGGKKKRPDVPRLLCLIHSEISEALEGHRKNLMDDKLPHRPMMEVELADAMIRIADLAGAKGFDLGGAVVEKMAYNKTRPDHQPAARNAKNGKKF